MPHEGPYRIVVVDDDPAIRDSLTAYLTRLGHVCAGTGNARRALRIVKDTPVDLVLSDISMPDMSGLDLLAAVKEHDDDIDVIMFTGYLDISFAIQAMRRGAYDFFTKPFNFEKIALTIERVREKQRLETNARRYERLRREQDLQLQTVLSLARAAEERDRGNIGHGKRVATYAVRLGRRLCFTEERLVKLRYGGLLHDIGKIGVDDAILNKPSRLTANEFQQMQRHSEIAEYILKPVSFLADVAPLVRSHHEYWDGSGYPDGLSGDAIPLGARIVGIVDYFDAVTSVRPYRSPCTLDDALELVSAESGRMFDPALVEVFCELMRETRATESTRTAHQSG